MGRIVTAVVTHDGVCAGIVGPFTVEVPWWAEVEPVVTYLEETLGVPVVVLRLLAVEGSDGARDGHVTYHAEALQPPGSLPRCHFIDDDHPLRQPWASASGVRELLRWASRHVDLTHGPSSARPGTWRGCSGCRPPAARSGSRPSPPSPPPSRPPSPRSRITYAVRYQEFLDNIEPSECVYHVGDPAAAIRQAIARAAARDGS